MHGQRAPQFTAPFGSRRGSARPGTKGDWCLPAAHQSYWFDGDGLSHQRVMT